MAKGWPTGVHFTAEIRFYFVPVLFHAAYAVSYIMGEKGLLSPELKRSGYEANPLPPSTTEVKVYVELYFRFFIL